MEHKFEPIQIHISGLHTIFAEPVDSNVGRVAMFIKNTYKVCEKSELKFPYSSKNKVEDLWVEIVNEIGEKHIVSVIYRHPKGNIKIFT